MRNSENIGHVLLKTVRRAITMLIITIWNKVFKNGPSKFVEADHISSNFLKAVFHKFIWFILEYFAPYIPKVMFQYFVFFILI